MKLVRFGFLFWLSILLFACGYSTPEQAADRTMQTEPSEQRLHVTKPAPDGVLVLFRSRNPKENQVEIGYGHVKQTIFGWQTQQALASSGAKMAMVVPELDEPVIFHISSLDNPNDLMIVFGFAQDERVTQIRVTFANGETLSDQAVQRMFGIAIAPKVVPCQIELRDAQDKILYQYSLHKNPDEFVFDEDILKWAQKECK